MLRTGFFFFFRSGCLDILPTETVHIVLSCAEQLQSYCMQQKGIYRNRSAFVERHQLQCLTGLICCEERITQQSVEPRKDQTQGVQSWTRDICDINVWKCHMEQQQILFRMSVWAKRAVCASQETAFDKLIHLKHPDGNMPTGCFSSSSQITLHSDFVPLNKLPEPERYRKHIRPTPDFHCLRHPISKGFYYFKSYFNAVI